MPYHLPDSYQIRPDPAPFLDLAQNVTWQPDVIPYAAAVARRWGADTLIDIGCGAARGLSDFAGEFRCIGLDLPEVLSLVDDDRIEQVPFDLASRRKTPAAVKVPGVVICSDVVEHLAQPDVLGRRLVELAAACGPVVISTPDRVRTRGPEHLGPPLNPSHAMEWARSEFVALLDDWGLVVIDETWTRSHSQSDAENTVLVLCEHPAPSGQAVKR